MTKGWDGRSFTEKFPPSYFREHPDYYRDDCPDDEEQIEQAEIEQAEQHEPVDLPLTHEDFIASAGGPAEGEEEPF